MDYVTPHSIEQSIDGGILICGGTNRNGGYAPFVMKLNACGEREWCKRFISQSGTFPSALDIKELDNGDIVVLVYSFGQAPDETVHLIKLNANGETLWIKAFATVHNYPESQMKVPRNLIITSDKKYLISGYGYWKHPWVPDGGYWIRPFFALSDSDGNEEWVLPFGIHDTIVGSVRFGLIEDSNGNFWGTGYKYLLTEIGAYGMLMNFDPEGSELGYVDFDFNTMNEQYNFGLFRHLASVDSMIVILSAFGHTSWPNEDILVGELLFDGLGLDEDLNLIDFHIYQQLTQGSKQIIKSLPSGKYLRNNTIRHSAFDYDIFLARCNLNLEYDTAYTGYFTYDSLCIPGPPLSGIIYLHDCDIVTSAEMPTPAEYRARISTIPITIYPNPAKAQITFALENTEHHRNIELRCFNLLGALQHQTKILRGQQQATANVSKWPPGMYIAVVYSDGKPVGRGKFVVQR